MAKKPIVPTPSNFDVGIGPAMRTRAKVYGDLGRTKNVTIDLDSCAEVNIVSKRLVNRLKLFPIATPELELESVIGPLVKGSQAYYISFALTDQDGVTRLVTQVFICLKRRPGTPDLLWSRPGMGKQGVILDTRIQEWWFDKSTIIDPLEFAYKVL